MPIVSNGDRYEAELFGVHRTRARRRGARAARARHRRRRLLLLRRLERRGRAARSATRPTRDLLLHRLMNERVEAWMQLATERLADSDVPLYLIPGNDDDFGDRSDPRPRRVQPGERRREGARHPRRAPAAVVRLVEPDAVADAARGARGRAVPAARRARGAGARSAARRLHDPRAAARLRARHRADPRREPPPHRLRRRRAARPGRLDRGAAR